MSVSLYIYIYKYIRIWVIHTSEPDSNIVSNIPLCLLICKNDIGVKNCYNKKTCTGLCVHQNIKNISDYNIS